jgi:hypothetical protein
VNINRTSGQIMGVLTGETDDILFTGNGTEAFHVHQISVAVNDVGDLVSTGVTLFHSHTLHAD